MTAHQLLPGPGGPENEVPLTFVEHLRDLRKRILHALFGVVAGVALAGWFVPQIRHGLLEPVLAVLPEGSRTIKYTGLIEPMMVSFKIALYGGVFLAIPWMLWQVWLFVAPGLYKREKRVVFPFLFFGTVLFYLGAAFCYWLVMPNAFPAMKAFADDPILEPMITLSTQYSLVLAMLLGFGIVFEVPVILAFLSMVGVVDARFLSRFRRHAIVVNVALAAILTPTADPLNLAIMAVPMIIFYEMGIVLARLVGKKPAAISAL